MHTMRREWPSWWISTRVSIRTVGYDAILCSATTTQMYRSIAHVSINTSRSIGHTVDTTKLRCRSTRESFRSIGYCSDLFAACTTGSAASMFRLVVGVVRVVVRLVVDNDDTHACHIHGNSCAILGDRIRNRSCQSIVGQVAVHHLQQQSTHGSKD
jgi:hypothetical protein